MARGEGIMETLPHCSGSAPRFAARRPDCRRRFDSTTPPLPDPRCRMPSTSRPPSPSAATRRWRSPRGRTSATRSSRRVDAPFDWGTAEAALAAIVEAGDPRALADDLRRLRRRVFVHTLVRDLTARADLSEVCADMTTLAETALRVGASRSTTAPSRRISASRATSRRDAQELVIVGMGKLGGRELNVSSDIDLVFVYPEDGETDGARTLSNREFFERLGRRVIGALHEITPEGFVFRVDVRLRPYGESGPLAVPYSALEQYLITQGRAWERYAWLKARALTGRRHDELDALVTPFVFRKYLDFDAYDGLRDIHRQIARAGPAQRLRAEHQARAGRHSRNRVHRAGAAARARRARARTCAPAARCPRSPPLAERGLLPAAAVAALRDAYVYLRNLEHRLQYRDDRQTQTLPAEPAEREALARAMGAPASTDFERDLAAHRAAVSAQFADLFGARGRPRRARDGRRLPAESDAAPTPAPTLSPPSGATRVDAEQARGDAGRRRLRRSGRSSRESRCAFARARGTCSCPRCRGSASTRSCRSCSRRRPPHRRAAPMRRRCSIGLFGLLETVNRRSAYLALLTEHPTMLPRLAQLMGASQWAADYLTRHPILLDELLDPRVLLAEPDWDAWRTELARMLERRCRRRRAADGRAPPFSPRAIVSPARAGSRLRTSGGGIS